MQKGLSPMFSKRTSLVILSILAATTLTACGRATMIVTQYQGSQRQYPLNGGGLVTAASWGDQEAVKQFLAKGQDVNATDATGQTALHAGAEKRDVLMVKLLLANGADPNRQTQSGQTALMLAAANADLETVKVLLAADADPSIENNKGQTAESIAASLGNLETVGLMRASR